MPSFLDAKTLRGRPQAAPWLGQDSAGSEGSTACESPTQGPQEAAPDTSQLLTPDPCVSDVGCFLHLRAPPPEVFARTCGPMSTPEPGRAPHL